MADDGPFRREWLVGLPTSTIRIPEYSSSGPPRDRWSAKRTGVTLGYEKSHFVSAGRANWPVIEKRENVSLQRGRARRPTADNVGVETTDQRRSGAARFPH